MEKLVQLKINGWSIRARTKQSVKLQQPNHEQNSPSQVQKEKIEQQISSSELLSRKRTEIYDHNQDGVSHTHRCCSNKRTHPWFLHKFHIVDNDKTAPNTSLYNVYCSSQIKKHLNTYHIVYVIRNRKDPSIVSRVPTLKLLLYQCRLHKLIQET